MDVTSSGIKLTVTGLSDDFLQTGLWLHSILSRAAVIHRIQAIPCSLYGVHTFHIKRAFSAYQLPEMVGCSAVDVPNVNPLMVEMNCAEVAGTSPRDTDTKHDPSNDYMPRLMLADPENGTSFLPIC